MDVLQAIGGTTMVRLRKVVTPGCADVLAKLEWENSTGSVKDRMARADGPAQQPGRHRRLLRPGRRDLASNGGKVDAFVHCVGTAASIRGVATVLKREKAATRIVAVEPAGSSVLRGGSAGPHQIEGVGIGSGRGPRSSRSWRTPGRST